MLGGFGEKIKWELVGRFLSLVSTGLLSVLLARFLSPKNYGLLFLAISLFTLFKLIGDLGIDKSTGRFLSEYQEKDPSQLCPILRRSLFLNLLSILTMSLLVVLSADIIANAIGEPSLESLIIFAPLFLVFSSFSSLAYISLQGLELIKKTSIINAVRNTTNLFFSFILVILGFGVTGALFGYIIAFLLATGLGFLFLHSELRNIATDNPGKDGLTLRIFKYSIPLTVTKTANAIDKRVDSILLGYYLDASAVGYYTIATQIQQFIKMPATAVGFTVSPNFGAKVAGGEIQSARTLYEKAFKSVIHLYIPASAGLFVVARPLVRLVFGDGYNSAVPIVQVFSFLLVFSAVNDITADGLDYIGSASLRAKAKTVMALSNLVLNIYLIPQFGVLGAAWATLTTFSVYTLLNLWILDRTFNLERSHLVIYCSKVAFVSFLIYFFTNLLIPYVSGWLSLGAVIVVGVLIWATLSETIGLFLESHYEALNSIF
jgi:O-antigen/teichoic acid export membrane protein